MNTPGQEYGQSSRSAVTPVPNLVQQAIINTMFFKCVFVSVFIGALLLRSQIWKVITSRSLFQNWKCVLTGYKSYQLEQRYELLCVLAM